MSRDEKETGMISYCAGREQINITQGNSQDLFEYWILDG